MGRLFDAVCNLDHLHRAWRSVRALVRRSSWPQLTTELGQIEDSPLATLRRIQRELRAGDYRFAEKWGYTKRKSGGSRRGITVHCVRDRIVQRALLGIFQSREARLRAELGEIPSILDCATSFAGRPGRGVPDAVRAVAKQIRAGARFVALSDVKDFFPCVPRDDVVTLVRANTADLRFASLFEAALVTELSNADSLTRWLDLFPLGERGVAQGSLLSVLAGNLALRHFDQRLNVPPVTTIRYLDDFAILGTTAQGVHQGFATAQGELAGLGMSCYAPEDGSQKAWLVPVERGFDFLGCRIHRDGISPSRRARRQLLDAVARALSWGVQESDSPGRNHSGGLTRQGYLQVLAQVDRQIRGWGNAFRFITNRAAFAQLDREIDELLAGYRARFQRQARRLAPSERRRREGITLLGDIPPEFGDIHADPGQ